MVGLIMPTTPRQLENAMSKPFREPVGHHAQAHRRRAYHSFEP
jgi:hypothetical protein